MRCSKRLPLIISVLALPLIIFAGTAEAKNKKAQDVETFEPELWQLRAYGHNHLKDAHRDMNMQLQAAKKAKKVSKKSSSSSSKNLKVAHDKGHNLAQASVPEEEFADYESSFQPELWQLRAHGHHFLLKNAYEKHQRMMKKGKAQQAKVNKKQGKKQAAVKGEKWVAEKRDLNEKKEQRILVSGADADKEPAIAPLADGEEDEEVDIAHHRRKHRHHSHEDDEHDKYDPDNELEGDDGSDEKGGGKGADKSKGKGKNGKNGGAPKKGVNGKAPNDPLDDTTPKDGTKPPKGGTKTPVDGKTPPAGAAPVNAVDPNQPPAAKPAKPVNKPAPIVPIQRMGDFVTKCNTPGQIALTYSEGPSEATTQMLEILKEAKARVTFFANATWLEYMQYAGVTRRAYNDGHLIGMTYRLPNDSSKSMTEAQLKADIAKQANKIYELIGKYPKYVRLHDAGLKDPMLEPTIRAMGYTLVGFNLDETDYKFNTREQAPQIADVYEQTFVKQADAFGRKGSYVVVGYDIPASGAAAALPDVISSIIRNEYDMVRLDGCNNDNKPYKRSPMLNDGFVSDDFSFGGTKYVHGQSPVAVQNGIAVPGQMPRKIGGGGGTRTANSSGSSSVVPSLFVTAMAVFVALAL
ncbi:hypothetical protein BGZ68_003095 [Mortierella alpina]|nr:hypothetical protein BGZ68_003095 [Mortierella alpina]